MEAEAGEVMPRLAPKSPIAVAAYTSLVTSSMAGDAPLALDVATVKALLA